MFRMWDWFVSVKCGFCGTGLSFGAGVVVSLWFPDRCEFTLILSEESIAVKSDQPAWVPKD